jgi:hypothetical protein
MRLIKRRCHDEQGSAIIIAITVIAIATILSVVVVSRTTHGLSSSRQNQDFAGALAQADAGVSDALFRIDQLDPSVAPADFCVGGTSCTVPQLPGAPDVAYEVEALDANTVRVRSKGLENGVPHAVEAQFARQLEFPFAIFGKTAVAFNGSANGAACTTATVATCSGVYQVDGANPPNVLPIGADVGTNGTVTCNGSGSPASHHATFPGGSSSGCPNAVVLSGSYNPLDPVSSCPAPVNTPPTPCLPSGHTVLDPSVCADMPATINPGVYLCRSHLTFTRNTTVAPGSANDGKVEIFVMPTTGTANVTFADVRVNHLGEPAKLRINLAGAGKLDGGNGNHAKSITGILYAPSATSTNNGCKIDIRGALVINDYTCNGGPNSGVQYDQRMTTLMQSNWTLENFREIPSSQVTVP